MAGGGGATAPLALPLNPPLIYVCNPVQCDQVIGSHDHWITFCMYLLETNKMDNLPGEHSAIKV